MTTYGVTGAGGQLGKLVLNALVKRVAPGQVVAFARDPGTLADHAAQGVAVRAMDYDQPEALPAALAGVDRLLLISGSAMGERPRQHGNVIDAAKRAGVGYIAYTSILRAQDTPIRLGSEHAQTEDKLAASGLPHDLLRHGWYNENYMHSLDAQIAAGVITGAQGQGRISSASRADLAAADALLLVEGKGGDIYELAGDDGWTMAQFATMLGKLAGKEIRYQDMGEADYAASLEAIGFPAYAARVIANSAWATSQGALEDNSGTLGRLLGRPTTPISVTLAGALKK